MRSSPNKDDLGTIKLETKIKSSPEICFDLSRSVDLHVTSAKESNERAIAGVTTGLLNLDDLVTWEAKHFGLTQQLKVKISKFDQPHYFQDRQVEGIFKDFVHDHYFVKTGNYTTMKDEFNFECPYGVIGYLADPFIYWHLKRFLKQRNEIIKSVAESDNWSKYI